MNGSTSSSSSTSNSSKSVRQEIEEIQAVERFLREERARIRRDRSDGDTDRPLTEEENRRVLAIVNARLDEFIRLGPARDELRILKETVDKVREEVAFRDFIKSSLPAPSPILAATPVADSPLPGRYSWDNYNRMASAYCRGVIGLWCLAGVAYSWATDRLLSLPTLLVVIAGLVVATVLAMVGFIPSFFLARRVDRLRFERRREATVLTMTFATLWSMAFKFVAPIVGAIVCVRLIRSGLGG